MKKKFLILLLAIFILLPVSVFASSEISSGEKNSESNAKPLICIGSSKDSKRQAKTVPWT